MRKIIASTYLTLDGRVDDLREWAAPYDSEPVAAYHSSLLANSDGLLLGRRTYEIFAALWPPRAGRPGYPGKINSMAKYVASTTVTDLAWENSHLIAGDVAEGVAKLKEQPGGDLVTYGIGVLTQTLRAHHLIDEYQFLLHPVVLGRGAALFGEGAGRVDLELVDSTAIDPGVVILTYRTAS